MDMSNIMETKNSCWANLVNLENMKCSRCMNHLTNFEMLIFILWEVMCI